MHHELTAAYQPLQVPYRLLRPSTRCSSGWCAGCRYMQTKNMGRQWKWALCSIHSSIIMCTAGAVQAAQGLPQGAAAAGARAGEEVQRQGRGADCQPARHAHAHLRKNHCPAALPHPHSGAPPGPLLLQLPLMASHCQASSHSVKPPKLPILLLNSQANGDFSTATLDGSSNRWCSRRRVCQRNAVLREVGQSSASAMQLGTCDAARLPC